MPSPQVGTQSLNPKTANPWFQRKNAICWPHSFLTTTYCPGLHHLKRILRDVFHILTLDPPTQDLLAKAPFLNYQKPPNHQQLIVDTSLRPYSPATTTGQQTPVQDLSHSPSSQVIHQLLYKAHYISWFKISKSNLPISQSHHTPGLNIH